ncbi:autotransporter outer membrane beta-barrel domain-containing protein [Thalassospira tepidiphila]|uniref:autotransporter outer membrane beta-barrel domain-containing protein n=1 Tax=Thalassospira tepidiphila TaxID=393657 RepID=UPI003AA9680D
MSGVKQNFPLPVLFAISTQSVTGRDQRGGWKFIVLLALCVVLSVAFASGGVKAATVTCTGAGAETATNASSVFYDASAGTCVVADGNPIFALGDIFFLTTISGSAVDFYADNNLDGTLARNDYISCTIGDEGAKTAPTTCNDGNVASGSFTNTLTAKVSSDARATMTVSYTVNSGNSVDITSASVSVVSESSSSSSSSSEAAAQALQASVSRSQTTVVSKNIESRVLSISIGRSAGAAQGQNQGDLPGTSNLVGGGSIVVSNETPVTMNSRGSSFRELAMKASFDTSRTTLSAAGDATEGNDPLRGIEQSLGLLADSGYTVWGHGSYTSVENEQNNSAGDSRYDGDVWGYNLGVDVRLRPELVGGISMGYSQTALTTIYNSGYYDETNWSFSPYVVYQPMDGVTLSTIVGYSLGDVELSRNSSITGSTDSDTWFGALNGAYGLRPSETLPLDVTLNVQFMAARKTVDGYRESDGTQVGNTVSNTRRLQPGVEVAYSFDAADTTVQPFARTDFIYDMVDEINGDKTAYNLGGGLRIISNSTGLSGSIEGERQFGTDDYSEYTVGGLVAYAFAVSSEDGQSLGIVAPYVKSNIGTDDAQTFGTGFTFADQAGAYKSEVNLTHKRAIASSETVTQISIKLAF